MNETFDHDFEVEFKSAFSPNVITNAGIPNDDDVNFLNEVETLVNNMQSVLQIQPGVHVISSYLDFNYVRYKITLRR